MIYHLPLKPSVVVGLAVCTFLTVTGCQKKTPEVDHTAGICKLRTWHLIELNQQLGPGLDTTNQKDTSLSIVRIDNAALAIPLWIPFGGDTLHWGNANGIVVHFSREQYYKYAFARSALDYYIFSDSIAYTHLLTVNGQAKSQTFISTVK